jgi:hypothetical protein
MLVEPGSERFVIHTESLSLTAGQTPYASLSRAALRR